jgi:hypothetical protein
MEETELVLSVDVRSLAEQFETIHEPAVQLSSPLQSSDCKQDEHKYDDMCPPVNYDFASIPKNMYLKEPREPPVEVARGPTSVSDMLKLKLATRERLRQQRWRKQREQGRNDLFTNPDKYITINTLPADNTQHDEDTSEEVQFLESFRGASRKPDFSGQSNDPAATRASAGSPQKGKTARGGQDRNKCKGSSCQSTSSKAISGAVSSSKQRNKPPQQQQQQFIPPSAKPLPSLGTTKPPPPPRPEVFRLPAQKIPSPRMLASSPRLLAAMTFLQKDTIDEFGYSSFSDNDDEEADPEHVQMAKQLEREERRQRREEAEYKNHMKMMETLSTDQVGLSTLALPGCFALLLYLFWWCYSLLNW